MAEQAPFAIVVAATTHQRIGLGTSIPWRLPKDMQHFKTLTTRTICKAKHNVVIMGRITYLSIPQKFRPLVGRINIVLTSNTNFRSEENIPDEVMICQSLDAFTYVSGLDYEQIFIIGGGLLYEEALKRPNCKEIFFTQIDKDILCDVFFPVIPDTFNISDQSEWQVENGISFRFMAYTRK
eukprot:TRINITY_DN1252_c0_g1_i1.p2 TRINITY_DN1252_c0_g1~~TRINITY_DN1252_c0_g1_i1.p2  ORF type:complete len:181 (-),score=28.06 TRINITY_DN1252_c0_g1_i1:1120-1662(-)